MSSPSGLLLVELPEILVVPGCHLLELSVIEVSQDVEPENVRLILKVQVIGFDEMNQRQLAGSVVQHYHDVVLHERGREAMYVSLFFVQWRTIYCARRKKFANRLNGHR